MIKSLKGTEASNISKEEAYAVIRNFISKEISLMERKMRSDEAFEKPAWAERQAYLLGGLKIADKILEFLPDQGN